MVVNRPENINRVICNGNLREEAGKPGFSHAENACGKDNISHMGRVRQSKPSRLAKNGSLSALITRHDSCNSEATCFKFKKHDLPYPGDFRMEFRHRVVISAILTGLFLVAGCKKDNGPTAPLTNGENLDIPADPGGRAPATTINNVTPAASFDRTAKNPYRVRINLLGIVDPKTGNPVHFQLSQAGTADLRPNLYVTEDGALQGIKVTSVGGGTTLAADIVFVVDNSGSMGEEADSIANKIIAFSRYLAASGVNARVGCVGYQYGEVSGARNLTDAASLRTYLRRPYCSGTSRTRGTGGPDSASLAQALSSFPQLSDENGILAIAFADSFFSWRAGAQRVYINFTDEAIQTGSQSEWSVDGLRDRWKTSKGSIHTVFSIDDKHWNGAGPDTSTDAYNYAAWQPGIWERPWSLSHFSGGTVKVIHGDGHDLELTSLPVTGALASSYLVEFVTSNPSIPHAVTIAVKTETADGKQVFSGIRY